MKRLKILLLILAVFILYPINTEIIPCTTFILRSQNHIYLGRNLDWISGTGLIMTNPKNLEKTALVDSKEKPAKWISRYGSLTFNQVGRELPFGGMNEAGLVVEHMSLEKTKYPDSDERCAIKACQWIQYQLDNCATVEEVIESDKSVRISDAASKFHFLICDRSGHTAAIEFLDGKMIYHTGRELAIEALANSTFSESMECINNYKKTGSNAQIESDRSLFNFATAAQMISQVDYPANQSPVNYSFNILKSVSQGIGTKWSIVYDITEMKVYIKVFETPVIAGPNKIFRKTPGESAIKEIEFGNFRFDCGQPCRVLDLETEKDGIVNQYFENYTTEVNKKFIVKAFTFYKGWWETENGLTEEEMDYLAKYPESFKCK
ncbi:MAG: linear amide C-N hydrolase [Syntrophothermus sp.]